MMFRLIAIFSLFPVLAAADEAPLSIEAIPVDWQEALPVGVALALDAPASTQLRFFRPPADPVASILKTSEHPTGDLLKEAVTTYLAKPENTSDCSLEIEWLGENPAPARFVRTWNRHANSTTSRYRLGFTTFSRTVLFNAEHDAILIHLHADHPGALSFSARISTPGKSELYDRRQIFWTSNEGDTKARLWVLPFESDVEDRNPAIAVRGEGEALLIINRTAEDTLQALGKIHDPGHQPPNPSLIWHGLVAAQADR